jgi:hypothetical protein
MAMGFSSCATSTTKAEKYLCVEQIHLQDARAKFPAGKVAALFIEPGT